MSIFHRHRWQIVDTKIMWRYWIVADTIREIRQPFTTKLERCGCGKTRTVDIDGHWTLDQLTGR